MGRDALPPLRYVLRMATYVVGDIQGCFATFENLLRQCDFAPGRDTLWLVGDLVNRGPRSLDVLRWVKLHESHVLTVLGNHDLHLIAVARGWNEPGKKDTLAEILHAPDREVLISFLRERPLVHREGDALLVHAGLLPPWTWDLAEGLARELEAALRGPDARSLLERVEADSLGPWRDDLHGMHRLRLALAALTRVRTLRADGSMREAFKGELHDTPDGTYPWFRHPERQRYPGAVYFGHWAALGLHREPHAVGLDAGCVWGRQLVAYRLDDHTVFSEPAVERR